MKRGHSLLSSNINISVTERKLVDDDPLYKEFSEIYKKHIIWKNPFNKSDFIDVLEESLKGVLSKEYPKVANPQSMIRVVYCFDVLDDKSDVIDVTAKDSEIYESGSLWELWKECMDWTRERYVNEQDAVSFMSRQLTEAAVVFSKRHPQWYLRTISGMQEHPFETGLDVSDPTMWKFYLQPPSN